MKAKQIMAALLTLLALCAGCAKADEITAEALKDVIDTSLYINLFDVRPEEEYEAGAIPGASSFPLDTLEETVRAILDGGFNYMSVDVYAYGATADDSARAAEILSSLGFTNTHYLAGVEAWPFGLERPGCLMGDMKTTDIYGQDIDESILTGKKLIMVNVWATYCNPCISEMQGLGELGRELAARDVQILGLVSDCSNSDLSAKEAETALAREIAEATGADYPHLLPSRTMYRNVIAQVQAVPTTFFLDGNGEMVGQVYLGARDEAAWREIVLSTLEMLE